LPHFKNPVFRFAASLRLAVTVIIALAIVCAIGTIYEAKYDARVAQKLVYHSIYMYIVLGALCVNLIAVMISRWPWKAHHSGFVLAHIGILTLLFGSWLTQKYGIDGSMVFEIGQERRQITSGERDIVIYSSLDGNNMRNIYETETDFLKHPPTPEDPFIINLGTDELKFIGYEHFAFRESRIEDSGNKNDGPAIRFQLENPNVNVTEWLRRDKRRKMVEHAKVVLTGESVPPSGRNEIILIADGPTGLKYEIRGKDQIVRKKGFVKQSETIETGWMGLKFRLLRYLPHARETVHFTPSPTNSPASNSAAKFTFRGQEYWIGIDSVLRMYLDDRAYLISFGHRQLDMAFPLKLNKFTIGKYQGTERAASYESEVEVPERGNVRISMNEPLEYKGFTFYQSSFEKNERGEPVISILSVNYDPGRWIKYLGSFLIVLGSSMLFWFKKKYSWFQQGSKA
jgi:hypothetical protein